MINAAGIAIIKKYEGFSAEVYKCPADVPTIGYGSTWDINGDAVTMDHPPVTRDQAEELLRREISHVEHAVSILIVEDIDDNEYSSLCSFTYNVGSGNLQRSTLRMKLNRGDHDGAANEFWKWRRAGGRILAGLVRRRVSETALFES